MVANSADVGLIIGTSCFFIVLILFVSLSLTNVSKCCTFWEP